MQYIDNKMFRRKNASKIFVSPLPQMPVALLGDPAHMQKRPVPTYVMSREEERQWFLEWNYAKKMVNRSAKARDPRTARKWGARARHLEEYLIRLNMALIYMMFARMGNRYNIDWDEGVSSAQPAMLRALAKFDVDFGTKFSTYGCRAILNAFKHADRKQSRHRSRTLASGAGEWFADGKVAVADTMVSEETAKGLNQLLESDKFTDLERLVINHRFGLNNSDVMTLEKIGDLRGISKERVRQIQNKVLDKLRRELV
jgi:RNA polymerase sigma factor (sigma-70 family)